MFEPLVGFRSLKAAQAAAFFASKENPIQKMKLIKLLYLTEREFLSAHGEPMFYDELFSLKDGPICSSCLHGIDGNFDEQLWASYVRLEGTKDVHAVHTFQRNDLDHLSDADLEAMKTVWDSFGFMTAAQIRAWTHKHCQEYTELTKGRIPIYYRDIMLALGDDEHDADEIEDRVRAMRVSHGVLSA